ncbi:hypothetical protein [Methyloprofundus sp.]|uniref:hypothetical protein n=1 Tax=Methyloprofundus sp. TaxID=2020875 RepID=UPI003D146C69
MFIQFLGSVDGGALFIARKMSVYRRGHPESYTSNKIKNARISLQSLIKVETDFTLKFIKSLEDMANIIDPKYRNILNQRISERLFILSILYLKKNMDKDFRNIVVQAQKRYKNISFQYNILYHFRFLPSALRRMIKLREFFKNTRR